MLISDFQKVGWANHNEIVFPQGTVVTPVDLGGAAAPRRRRLAGDDRSRQHAAIAITSPSPRGSINTGARAEHRDGDARPSAGATCRRSSVTVPATGAQQVAFTSIAVPSGATKGIVRITPDSLTQDDVLNFTIAPDEAVPVLIVEPASPRDESESVPEPSAGDRRPSVVPRR